MRTTCLFSLAVLAAATGCHRTEPQPPGPCAAKTCASEGLQCGFLDDGCGATRLCGECAAGLACVAGACVVPDGGTTDAGSDGGCVPRSCPPTHAAECADLDDGCGHHLGCGCAGGAACVAGLCGCPDDGGCTLATPAVVATPGGTVELAYADAGTSISVERSDGTSILSVAAGTGHRFVDANPPAVTDLAYRLLGSGGERSSVILVHRSNAWPTMGGDNQHSGANPLEQGGPPLDKVWVYFFGQGGESPAVYADGRVYVAGPPATFGDPGRLVALAAADGGVLFTRPYDYPPNSSGSYGWPAVYDGRVFASQCAQLSSPPVSSFIALDAVDGGLLWMAPITCQFERYWAPVVEAGVVYGSGGAYGGLYGVWEGDGGVLFASNTSQSDQWSPATYGGLVYSFVSGVLLEHDPLDGSHRKLAQLASNGPGPTTTYPVIADGRIFVVSPPVLYAIDQATFLTLWSSASPVTYYGRPAYYQGVLYAIGLPGTLIALDPGTGTVLWTFAGDGALRYPPVFAGHHLYVASDSNVYAVDLLTHSSDWQSNGASPGGELSIAGGMLFVSGWGLLTAYSLTP